MFINRENETIRISNFRNINIPAGEIKDLLANDSDCTAYVSDLQELVNDLERFDFVKRMNADHAVCESVCEVVKQYLFEESFDEGEE